MTKWEYWKKYINELIEGDLLESGCSEETANEYKSYKISYRRKPKLM